MSLIRPSFVENLYTALLSLDPSRPMYYILVVRLTRNIFMSLGFDGSIYPDKISELNNMIKEHIEIPLEAPFVNIVTAYDNPKFAFTRKAFTMVGDGVDAREVTRWEIMQRLEIIKNWCYDEIIALSPHIRFTKSLPVFG